ncbi:MULTISPECIES: AAA family ATPase [Flavobacteriaceae]|jgi:predicted ATPase|uniref:ATP-binding protein n=1 Tax=Autumnicola musiva TaxID=3075589 RepID=A0ABU3D1V8_9FLAO|nr:MULTISPECIES: ATP-binding protein [Flavobacteriaceae]MBO2545390.1 ATP-binding protein [Salegentibacter sp. BDJ18]MDT0675523.1 ATP-binding protein [Zunongwangia sp. F117]
MQTKKASTNWQVITGGPSTGKTTVINMLAERGYKTTIEHARHYIDTMRTEGQTVEELRSNRKKFQIGVLDMQIEQEASILPQDLVFLDRAIPDAMAYYQFLKLDYDEKLLTAVKNTSYKKIFILDRLPFTKDYARTEDEEAQKKIHQLIIDVYTSLGFPIVSVPVLPPTERVEFILKNIE